MPRIYLNAFWVALMILTNLGSTEICEAQNKKDKLANEKTTGVLIQKEKGPSGHSTIGIVESTIERDTGETLALTFSRLMTWKYDANNDTPPPEKVEELDGRKVKLTGFMYPLQQGDSIQYFCLLRTTQTCCYGPRPQFNQYVFVEMVAPTEFSRLDPVSCVGKFRVEPTPDEGYIYRIVGQRCKPLSGRDRE
ncbi:MAG: DUF3299 domain-containing protein [Desulfobacterales bacterium]|nr:DUF3299 domain-containing protein [Desulfobacterales bacterium]